MLRAAIFLLSLPTVTVPAAAQRQPHGIFFGWGAFEERNAKKCFAIAEPVGANRESEPFVSVGFWPERGVGPQLHVRLSRAKRDGSAVILRIDERVFQLEGRGADVWAARPSADKAIAAAMRTGVAMRVESRAPNGAKISDRYALRGAASAIDAAAVACAR